MVPQEPISEIAAARKISDRSLMYGSANVRT
jgi:hypothetical protein